MKAEDLFYKEGRSGTADLLKGLAVIFMIQVHLTELFALEEVYYSGFGNISLFLGGPPAAPLFMMVMGYFLMHKSKSSMQLLIRGVKLFLGGILLNISFNFNLIISHLTGRLDYNIEPLQYIFGADILHLAGLSLIVIAGLQKLFKSSYFLYFLSALAVVTAGVYLNQLSKPDDTFLIYTNAFLWGDFSWSYFPLFPWLAYPLTGAGFYFLRERFAGKLNDKYKSVFLLIWGVFIILTISYGIETASELMVYYHHGIQYYLWILFFLAGFGLLTSIFYNKYKTTIPLVYVKWIGQNVTLAYVFQWIIIGNIATEIYRTQQTEDVIFWFIGITIVVSVLIYLYRKLLSSVKTKFTLKTT
jgi:uncharacterized membrane protein